MKKRIYMVRHGETEFNKRMLFQGELDSPLTCKGFLQAKNIGKWFKENRVVFDGIYCSPANRCLETLKIITKKPFIIVNELHEMKFGRLEGQLIHFDYLPADSFIKDNGGENYKELESRTINAIDFISKNNEFENILIVAHSGNFSAFAIKNGDGDKLNYEHILPNSAILIYEYENGKYYFDKVVNFSDN